jgi:predicted CopG family antitoxin
MKIELNDVKLELSSFSEIIRVLQEKIRETSPSTQPTEDKGNAVYEDKESYTLSANKE